MTELNRLCCAAAFLVAAALLLLFLVWALCWVARHADEVADLIWRKRNE